MGKKEKAVILIVDDEVMWRDMCGREYEKHPLSNKYQLLADSGLAASERQVLDEKRVVAVISDYRLVGRFGDEVLTYFASKKPGGTCVLISSNFEGDILREVASRGSALPVGTKFFNKHDMRVEPFGSRFKPIFDLLILRLIE